MQYHAKGWREVLPLHNAPLVGKKEEIKNERKTPAWCVPGGNEAQRMKKSQWGYP